MISESRSAFKRYGFGVAAIVLGTAARIALRHWFHYDRPYAPFYIAVLLTGWYGGIRPALVAIALGAAAVILLALGVVPGAHGRIVGLDFYFVVSLTAAILMEQRNSAQESARSAEAQLRVTLESAPVGICRIALDGTFVEANARFSAITGYSSAELLNRHFRETSEADDVVARFRNLARAVDCEDPFCREERHHVRKDGTALWVVLMLSFVRDRNGRPQFAVGLLQDVTERKQADEQIRKAQQIEGVGLLAGGIAHDFNNLLTSILGNASLAMSAVAPDSEAHKMLRSITASGERAAQLTSQLLAYAGKSGFSRSLLDLSETAREAAQLARPSIPERIELRTDFKDGLPLVRGDRSQISQLVTGLLMNAAEAIEDKTGVITISTGMLTVQEDDPPRAAAVGEVRQGRYLVLSVQDTGIGIADSVMPRMFDPFFTTKFTGRGLGLAAVSGIVRTLQGAVMVSSTPGEGTTLKVLFPPDGASPR